MGTERILITGASGFLGAGLARRLIGAGAEVHLLLRSGTDCRRLSDLEGRCSIHWADLRAATDVHRAVAECQPQTIFHLAAAGVRPGAHSCAELLAHNAVGTANLLKALICEKECVFVHVGSGAEYGPRDGPIAEDEPLHPRTDYAVSKAAASLLCQAAMAEGRAIVLVRVFAAYGPGETTGRLVPYLMDCCRRGDPPQVSSGDQWRDFIFLEDVLDLLCVAARCPAAIGRVLHAGTGQAIQVKEMVKAVLEQGGGSNLPVRLGARQAHPGETSHYLASIEQTRRLTGWQPRHDLYSGIRLTWDWFRCQPAVAAA